MQHPGLSDLPTKQYDRRLDFESKLKMIELRPQPIGIFPFPAANLLLPNQEVSCEAAIQALLSGDVSVELPLEWTFFALAAKGDVDAAIKSIQSADGLSPIHVYNLFVLSPSPDAYQAASEQLTGELRELLDVAAYTAGVIDSLADEFSLDDELGAIALATSAATDIEKEDFKSAQAKLKTAVAKAKTNSPILAALLLSQVADLAASLPDFSAALVMQDYKIAIDLAKECKLPMLLPELYTKMGMMLQNASNGQRGALLQAVNSYQSALQSGVTQEEHPLLFAQLQNNLGLAYLSMPAMGASHQLRSGIAVQSFRHALKVYTIEDHPDMWASVSMNLANALQYAPSSHPEDNLIQAVETYEDVLQVRSRAKDPVAYALVLLNQANALAHLGMFKPALEKLAEAYKLFHWYDHIEQANAAQELVEQINQKLGDRGEQLELSKQ